MRLVARRRVLLVSILVALVAAEGIAKHNEYPRESFQASEYNVLNEKPQSDDPRELQAETTFKGRMWLDNDPKNSKIDEQEQGVPSGVVELWRKKPDGKVKRITSVNCKGDGSYEIRLKEVRKGEYFLKFSHSEKAFDKFTDKTGDSHANVKGKTRKFAVEPGKTYTKNAGLAQTGVIYRGRMWFDINPKNGRIDKDKEEGVSRGTVELWRKKSDKEVKRIDTTNLQADGSYEVRLETVRGGKYFLKFSHEDKDFNKFTSKVGGLDASHVNSRGETKKRKPKAGRTYVRNAGIIVGAAFRGKMWFDDDMDSRIDSNEPGVGSGGVRLYRVRAGGRPKKMGKRFKTDSDGSYVIQLGSVDPMAVYYLKFDHREYKYIFTRDRRDSDADANGESSRYNVAVDKAYIVNAGIVPTGRAVMYGNFWKDTRIPNSLIDDGEKGVGTGRVILYRVSAPRDVRIRGTSTIKADGSYSLAVRDKFIEAGPHYLLFKHREGTKYVFVPRIGDSNVDPLTGRSSPNLPKIQSGKRYRINAGIRIANVVGTVFEDKDKNGVLDSGEPGISDVQVLITDSSGASRTVTTDRNGEYSAEVSVGSTKIDIVESTLPLGAEQSLGTNPTTVDAPLIGTVADLDGYYLSTTSPTTAPSLASVVTPVKYRIDFDTYPDDSLTKGGDYVGIEWLAYGVSMTASGGLGDRPRLFDTANPGTVEKGDPDLGSPNEKCPIPGPGQGEGGEPDVDGANCEPQRRVLIIQEENEYPDIPDDNERGGIISFMFTKPVTFHAIGLMDIDKNSASVRVEYSGGVDEISVSGAGDNSVQTVSVGLESVNKVEVRFDLSGAVTFIDYSISLDSLAPSTPSPSKSPIVPPTSSPSESPSEAPSPSPTVVTARPTKFPVTPAPTAVPPTSGTESVAPSDSPSESPMTSSPTAPPTNSPTRKPFKPFGAVRGTVFKDENGNGVQDPSEPGIEGVSVAITDSYGGTFTLTTDANGNYFEYVPIGTTFIIAIDEGSFPAGFKQTVGTNPTEVIVLVGDDATDLDGFFFPTETPTKSPTSSPTLPPISGSPPSSGGVSPAPSSSPSESPSEVPTASPSMSPSELPTTTASPQTSGATASPPTSGATASPPTAGFTPAPPTGANNGSCLSSPPDTSDSCTDFEDGRSCEYGEECCCGECFPSQICDCSGGQWGCFFTDACLAPCPTKSPTVGATASPPTAGFTPAPPTGANNGSCLSSPPDTSDSCTDFEDGRSCEYGEECCCGECFPSQICDCSGGQWGCFFTDACLAPCPTKSPTVGATASPPTAGFTPAPPTVGATAAPPTAGATASPPTAGATAAPPTKSQPTSAR